MTEHHVGMGAIPHDGGAAFRVWAPHADEVRVMGSFNGWNGESHPLQSEGNGYWYTDVAGVEVGAEYKYVLRNGDRWFDKVDPYARAVTNSVGNGIVYDHGRFDWEGDNFACPPHNELVIYEMHVGSFVGGGDLHDVREKLGHFTHLGVNAIQLMPLMEFAGDSSWGYNPAHPFAVESTYGGPDALKLLVREAHKMGIAVIVDVVYNHFGPSDLDLWQFDGWSEDGKGGIYFYNDWRSQTPWGDTRPDYGREEVRRYIHDNALMWLRDYHVDGLRYDMTPFMRSVHGSGRDIPEGWDLMRWINDSIRSEFPGRIAIAEDLLGDPAITSTGSDGAHFHAQWDALFVHPVRAAVTTGLDEYRSVADVSNAITHSYGDAFGRVIYTESHDEVANGRARVPQEIENGNPTGWPAQKRSTLAAALVFTSPGIPMVFQGQEFLEGEYFRDEVPLDWHKNANFQGIVRLYRDLARLRRNFDDDTRGLAGQHVEIIRADDDANMLAFHRWRDGGPGDDVVVIANLSAQAREDYRIGMPAAGEWQLKLNSDAQDYSAIFGNFESTDLTAFEEDEDGMPAHTNVSIGPYSVLIYSRK